MRLISSVALVLSVCETNEWFVSKKWKSLEHFFNALLFLLQTKKLYATERHFESEKPYFSGSMPELYVCACQKHLVFAVNLHQIVCFRHWKRKVSIFIAMVETFFCRTLCRRFWLLLLALGCVFFFSLMLSLSRKEISVQL